MRKILLYCMCLMMAMPIMAREKPGGENIRPDEYGKKLENHLRREAGINDEEATKFFPLFHEMKAKQMKVGQKIMQLKKDKCPDRMSEKECTETVLKVESLKVEQAKIGEAYFKKMCKVISGQKVLKALNAEDEFHRIMFHNFHNPPKQPKRRRWK